jgi:glycosyltransferase involved in cell wall biosynthesis
MRILVISDPHIPVPPTFYGGTERIVHLLCEGLAERGYTVDLIAAEGSDAYGGRLYTHKAPTLNYLSRAYRKIIFQVLSLWAARAVDVVITFGRPDYLWALYRTSKPIIIRFANPLDQRQIDAVLSKRPHQLRFIGVSHDHVLGLTPEDKIDVVYNAINLESYPFRAQAEQPPYMVFLGRLTRNKGVGLAIQAARAAGVRLVIAGNIPTEPGSDDFFKSEVEPSLGDDVQWIGPIDDSGKATLLGGATALLFPIQWREPFGMVMIEALACGCPVIAWRNGSVPEVVQHGETGYIVESPESMAAAIAQVDKIDRHNCRRDVEQRFSSHALVDGDLSVFRKIYQPTSS